jgi:hypothetical protein
LQTLEPESSASTNSASSACIFFRAIYHHAAISEIRQLIFFFKD